MAGTGTLPDAGNWPAARASPARVLSERVRPDFPGQRLPARAPARTTSQQPWWTHRPWHTGSECGGRRFSGKSPADARSVWWPGRGPAEPAPRIPVRTARQAGAWPGEPGHSTRMPDRPHALQIGEIGHRRQARVDAVVADLRPGTGFGGHRRIPDRWGGHARESLLCQAKKRLTGAGSRPDPDRREITCPARAGPPCCQTMSAPCATCMIRTAILDHHAAAGRPAARRGPVGSRNAEAGDIPAPPTPAYASLTILLCCSMSR